MSSIETPIRILFVDDDPAMRRAFRRTLKKRGFEVDIAGSGQEAVTLAEQTFYPVVVTDLRMPGMDGFALTQKIKDLHKSTTFVMVTGVPELDLKRDYGDDASITAILPKPWEIEELVQAIEHASTFRSHRLALVPPDTKGLGNKVLVLEENPKDAEMLANYFEEVAPDRFLIHHVSRVSDAVDALRKEQFMMVIADLSVPDAGRMDALDRLHRSAPQTAIVILSSVDDEEMALQAVQGGAQDYLVKGHIDRFVLYRAIRYAVERKKVEQRLAHLAHFDQLTGVANRVSFHERLAQQVSRSQRTHEGFALMFLDLDRFKGVNDTLGHDAGDQLLKLASTRIKEAVREYDTVARLGGDEFSVIIDEPVSDSDIKTISDRILRSIAEPFRVSGCEISISVSIGVAVWPDAGENSKELLKAADTAMYAAKEAGRACWKQYSSESRKTAQSDLKMEVDLRRAVENEEFVLHYQPILNMASNRVVGFEALIRWSPAEGMIIPPDKFIPVLESSGLINEAGSWAIREGCRQLREWSDNGMGDLRLALNVSVRQLERPGLIEVLRKALSDYHIEPSRIEIEITESLLMRDTEEMASALANLKALGLRIAIDDFGTGYSCLSYLQRFEVDTIKIDRSFVDTIGNQKEGSVLADAILSIGRKLGLEVVAEGVENHQQGQHLLNEGCTLAQGYYFAKPSPHWTTEKLGQIQGIETQKRESVRPVIAYNRFETAMP